MLSKQRKQTMTEHIPVLLKETIEGLRLKQGDVVVDGTVNTGGHSKEICFFIGEEGCLVGIDRDSDALAIAKEYLKDVSPEVILIHGNYRNMDTLLAERGILKADNILLDIGLSTRQLFDTRRGFSFTKDEPLLMTFNPYPQEGELTAEEMVNEWDEENLADIIFGYGEERFARKIARAIVRARETEKITSTFALAKIIEDTVPLWYRKKRIHPATKTFQALRITVNDELGALKEGIAKSLALLKKGGRLAIITFHSGEDRIVKKAFRDNTQEGRVVIVTKKPIIPSVIESVSNPKSRSAKLRIVEKVVD